jgi:hypothetical protein
MFRISNNVDEVIVYVNSLAQIGPTILAGEPGRYLIDEVQENAERYPADQSRRPWGTAVHHPDGRVALRPFFYFDGVSALRSPPRPL